ncbi:DNA-formamidopyrimidine glycosylase [Lentilactobacillus raoultii]|uniref:Formamidopyrimidine-DNA glycosylase n=1 Tax=Lentilactobacillus raoultii TaxID=1987503 RepID=A0ABW3PR98_9LACO|nr:DNA-formamidopyrimidine glycosylase [Lentilactobacillus raoultii]
MPELPEVETVRRGLTELVAGSRIKTVDVLYPKMINLSSSDFAHALQNQTIDGIDRRGKYLFIRIGNGLTIVSHLRMEGKYDVEPEGVPLSKHTHIVFHLADGRQLRYNDTRKFGRMNLVTTGQEMTVAGLKTIGPEPTEETLTLDYMRRIFGKSRKLIKPFLLDQSNIAGLGNIYADEVLWLSKIHPKQPVNTLSVTELKELRQNIIEEIKRAIAGHGTTVHSYSTAYGEAGSFQNNLNVYGREGQPCLRCGTPIEKIKLAQRGTHFCPTCQVIHGDRHG